MINLSVDEAYAFDYLSILHVKKEINPNSTDNWDKCYDYIQGQISEELMDKIMNSKEYFNMIDANRITFNAVEQARYGSITAKQVDEANMLRYKRKLEFQAEFFNNKLTEIKT